MEKISITFLGTANAIPTSSRNHSSIFLNYKNENILIDCGEGTQRQLRKAKLSPSKISRILITHWHGDHILGLPGLFQTLAMSDYSRTLEIYGPEKTNYFLSIIEKLMTRFKIKIHSKEIHSQTVLETNEFKIEAIKMSHKVPALAYSFIIKDKIRLDKSKLKKLKLPNSPLLKKLQEGKSISFNKKTISPKQVCYIEKGKKVTIILDTAPNPNTIKLAKNSDLLICESSFSEEESAMASEKKHLTSKQAAEIAKHSKSKSLILTHISQRYEHKTETILNEAKSVFKNTKIAKDLDEVTI